MANEFTSAEQLANHFISYLFEKYKGARHVRRVASWIGFIIIAIGRIAGRTLQRNRQRQITFKYKGRRFKAKYNHMTGSRGGIDIIEVLKGRGAPEGTLVMKVKNLSEAEACYLTLKDHLDSFIAHS